MDTKGALDKLFADLDENTRRESGEVLACWISRFVTTTETLDAARADIAEANAALDEAGEPRDDGGEALSLASRIRNVVVDRDGNRTRADDLDAMVRDEQRLSRGLHEDIARLTAERDAANERAARVPELVSECRSLRERLKDALAARDAAVAEVKGIAALMQHHGARSHVDALQAQTLEGMLLDIVCMRNAYRAEVERLRARLGAGIAECDEALNGLVMHAYARSWAAKFRKALEGSHE